MIHHSWTSVRGKDYVWIPLSWEEYCGASPARRWLERLYRGPLGHGIYYGIELWLRKVVVPSFRRQDMPRPSQRFDVLLTAAFLCLWCLAVIATRVRLDLHPAEGLFFAVGVPVATWFWGFGFVLYVQHTHPRSRYFASREPQDFYRRQLAASTHVVFPFFINRLFHGIFEHSAHHLDVQIPFYRLGKAQARLDALTAGSGVVVEWTPAVFWATVRTCKLYDYDRGQWLGFDGKPSR